MCSYQPGFYPPQIPALPIEPVPDVPPANQPAARAEAAAANERAAGAGPRREVVRMNAQGGAPLANDDEDEDELRDRDWLDWVYMLTRLLLLLCILYFYSSFDRFIATTILITVIYLSVLYTLLT